MEKLPHPLHEHLLTFIEEFEKDDVRCDGCMEFISGPCYSCDSCGYFLHKSCAELPAQINHPVHPLHTLLLYHQLFGKPCFSCKRSFRGFYYGCFDCSIILDIMCGHTSLLPLQRRIQHRTHNTSIYIKKLANFSCDACGVKHEGKSYLCTTCDIMVNETCHASPKSFRHNDHEHDLFLADCLPFEDFKFLYKCEICHEMLSREYWTYCCKKCLFFVHLKCTKSKTKLSSASQLQIDEANLITLPLSDESVDLIALFMKKISGQGNYERAAKFNHPSHVHPLILSDDRSKAPVWSNARHVEQCNGCALPVLAPFYHCAKTECRYFLHEWCARLPEELQHPSHPEHTLKLDTGLFIDGIMCDICLNSGNIFMYRCSTCVYKIDCKCASLASIIKHEAHEHALVWERVGYYIYCSLCANYGQRKMLACDSCSFNMCSDCAMLRRVMRHRYDKHPLRLAYSPSHLDADEFYCEICEKEIDPKIRFYHCVACDQSIHPKCILPRYPNWKFGITVKFGIHPHILTLVMAPKGGTACGNCDSTVEFKSYECETCGFWLHSFCAKGMNYLK